MNKKRGIIKRIAGGLLVLSAATAVVGGFVQGSHMSKALSLLSKYDFDGDFRTESVEFMSNNATQQDFEEFKILKKTSGSAESVLLHVFLPLPILIGGTTTLVLAIGKRKTDPIAIGDCDVTPNRGKGNTATISKMEQAITFEDVAGLEEVKKQIKIKMINPMLYPELYKLYHKETGGGVLLYGPPGNGKTMIAKAIANEVGAKFYAIKSSDIVSKYQGETERNIKELFANANKQQKAIIFIDEIDSLFGYRGRNSNNEYNDTAVNEFLQQMDGFSGRNPNLLILGATNRPWSVDSAATRPGRLSQKIYVPLPDEISRKAILEKNMLGVPVSKNLDIDDIVSKTDGFSGADIAELCDRAKDVPLSKAIESGEKIMVSNADFDLVLKEFKPSVSQKEIDMFEAYNRGEIKNIANPEIV